MSASPSKPLAMRKRQPASVFVKKKAPVKRAVPPAPAKRPTPQPQNGASTAQPHTNGAPAEAAQQKENDDDWEEYPIYVSKKDFTQELHCHVMKLHGHMYKDNVPQYPDPYNQEHFIRPLTLTRRNAREKIAQPEQSDATPGIDDKDRELRNIQYEERQRQKEANQAQIAPTGGDSRKPARQKPRKKIEDVVSHHDEHKAKQSKIKFEEARPWHLDDFEHKNVWVGNYQEPVSEKNVMFEINPDGFRMVPVEKWYKFQQANRVNSMDSEAVEKEMAKPAKIPRWVTHNNHLSEEDKRRIAVERRRTQMRSTQRGGDDDEDRPVKREDYNADVDEMDYEFNDEFQDDDEGLLFGDQDADEQKDIDKRMRDEMRNAGLGATGIKDEDRDYDAEEAQDREAQKQDRKMTRRLRKALMKKERKNEYDDDSEHGEFSESSESEDSEEERERLEQERKEEEARKVNGEKSGVSTKGTNTPSGRSEKKDSARMGNALKRPGSPDLSEVSGNESSRKRAKMNGAPGANGARALSPEAARGSRPPRSHTGGSGSGSETEASNREGRPKIRIRNSPPTSPNGSRTGTPSGSRAQSPQRNKRPFPTLEEVRAAIPADGIAIGDLVNLFRSRVQGRQAEFIPLVKSAGRQDPTSKKILPKSAAEVQAQQQQQKSS